MFPITRIQKVRVEVGLAIALVAPVTVAQADLNTRLREAVCSQQWNSAIQVVDQMLPLVTDQSPLISYRQRLQILEQTRTRAANWSCDPTSGTVPALPALTNTAEPPQLPRGQTGRNPNPDIDFWEGLLEIADEETEQIAQSLGPQALQQYGRNLCSILSRGGRLRDVPPLNTGRVLASNEFYETLQEASVSSYCPQYFDRLQ